MVLICPSCDLEFEVDEFEMGSNVFDCPECEWSFEKYIDKDDLPEFEL